MRLFELEDQRGDVINILVLVLRNAVGRGVTELSYSAIKGVLQDQNIYMNVDYKTFDSIYHQNPRAFSTVVNNYNGTGIVLNTSIKAAKPGGSETPVI
jgi:hypothetical protein